MVAFILYFVLKKGLGQITKFKTKARPIIAWSNNLTRSEIPFTKSVELMSALTRLSDLILTFQHFLKSSWSVYREKDRDRWQVRWKERGRPSYHIQFWDCSTYGVTNRKSCLTCNFDLNVFSAKGIRYKLRHLKKPSLKKAFLFLFGIIQVLFGLIKLIPRAEMWMFLNCFRSQFCFAMIFSDERYF